MSDLRKAAEQVSEAWDWDWSEPRNKALKERIDALRQAVAQPEQEPVGYVTIENISSWAQVPSIKWFKKLTEGPLYTAPPISDYHEGREEGFKAAKCEHEPFIYVREDNEKPFGGYEHCSEVDAGAFPVYTSPPKREWVGLTDDEMFQIHTQSDSMQYLTFGKAIEAKLKEKNGG